MRDTFEMAREAELLIHGTRIQRMTRNQFLERLKAFEALARADEREACASICFQEGPSLDGELIAAAIRARGETK